MKDNKVFPFYTNILFRNSIAESMVWCIEQAECVEEVVECITESLSILEVRHHCSNKNIQVVLCLLCVGQTLYTLLLCISHFLVNYHVLSIQLITQTPVMCYLSSKPVFNRFGG